MAEKEASLFKWIDHIVIAVNDVEQSLKDYETKLGIKAPGKPETVPELGTKEVRLPLGGSGPGRSITLAEPLGPDTALSKSLARRGEGVHLIALAVEDKNKAVSELKARGVHLVETAGGRVFVHPKETHGVLYQLIERR